MSEFITVAKVGSIEDGKAGAFPVKGKMVAVFLVDGKYHAINDFCPHMGAPLSDGHVEDGVVICPWHAWQFKVCDGTWCDNPAIKTDAYEVRIQGDEIQVLVPDEEALEDADETPAPSEPNPDGP
jgi:nitrite reductase (NADH) small subunit/3-phenylpropionate/trans-cinnamate dioxygenase ferredoxin subunit